MLLSDLMTYKVCTVHYFFQSNIGLLIQINFTIIDNFESDREIGIS